MINSESGFSACESAASDCAAGPSLAVAGVIAWLLDT